MKRVHAIIHGHVQGVFFRQSTQEQAAQLGLRGWVRNRRSGTVEMVAEGDAEGIESLMTWCNRGPERARVDRIERIDGAPAGLPEGFNVRPTE